MNQAIDSRLYSKSRPAPRALKSESNVKLTAREQDVLALLACGLQNKEIAKVLDISPATVGGYLKEIYGKLRVNNRTAATFVALEMGLLTSRGVPVLSASA